LLKLVIVVFAKVPFGIKTIDVSKLRMAVVLSPTLSTVPSTSGVFIQSSVGMAVALAAQDTFRNLFGSFVLFADKAFQTDDWIKTPEVEGTVESVGLRTTAIRNFDTSVVLIPNGNLANTTITNFNKCAQRRIVWTLPITGATATALENIVRRLNQYIENHPDIEKEKQPIVIRLDSFGENCINLFCYFFTKTTEWLPYLEIKEGILLEFKKIVAEEKASFGVPTRLVLLNEINK